MMKKINLLMFFLMMSFVAKADAGQTLKFWWTCGNCKNPMLVFKDVEVSALQRNPQTILDLLLHQQPRGQYRKDEYYLKVRYVSHDGTVFIDALGDPHQMTELGDQTGLAYASAMVFTLTELKGIKAVYFLFEGAHFAGGQHERLDFWPYMSGYRKSQNLPRVLQKIRNSLDMATIHKLLLDIKDVGGNEAIEKLEQELAMYQKVQSEKQLLLQTTLTDIKSNLK
jgi:hypothetical protein